MYVKLKQIDQEDLFVHAQSITEKLIGTSEGMVHGQFGERTKERWSRIDIKKRTIRVLHRTWPVQSIHCN